MISPISFGSTTSASMSFQDRIRQPQAFTMTEKPAASTGINDGEKKKGGFGKTLLKLLVGAGIIAAGLALANKYGLFAVKEGGNEMVNKAKTYLGKAGQYVSEKAGMAKDYLFKSIHRKPVE